MEQIAEEFKILSLEEQNEAYEKAKSYLAEQDANWVRAQEKFLDENPEYRDNVDLNCAFVSEVNKLIATEKGMALTDRQVLKRAFLKIFLK